MIIPFSFIGPLRNASAGFFIYGYHPFPQLVVIFGIGKRGVTAFDRFIGLMYILFNVFLRHMVSRYHTIFNLMGNIKPGVRWVSRVLPGLLAVEPDS